MQTLRATLALAGVTLLAACWSPPSLQPLFEEGDGIFEPALLGAWVVGQIGDETVLTFADGENGDYQGTFTQNDRTERFEDTLGRLGPYVFLSTEGTEGPDDWNVGRFHYTHVIPVYSFYRLELSADTLEIAYMDRDWLAEQVKEGKVYIPYALHGADDAVVFTASPDELQAFVALHVKDDDAWERVWTFERRNPTGGPVGACEDRNPHPPPPSPPPPPADALAPAALPNPRHARALNDCGEEFAIHDREDREHFCRLGAAGHQASTKGGR